MNAELSYEVYNDKSFVVRGNKDKYSILMKKCKARWNPRLKQGAGWIVNKEYENEIKNIIQSLVKVEAPQQQSFTSNDTESEADIQADNNVVEKVTDEEEENIDIPIVKNPNIHREISASKYILSESEDEQSEHEDNNSEHKSMSEEKMLQLLKSEQAKKFELEKKQFEESKKQVDTKEEERKRKKDKKKRKKEEERSRDKERKEERSRDKERKEERNRDKERKKERKEEKRRSSPHKQTDEDRLKYYKAFSKKPKEFKEMYPSSNEEINFSCSDSETPSSDNSLIPETPKRRHTNKEENYDELFSKVKYLQKKISELELKNKKQKY